MRVSSSLLGLASSTTTIVLALCFAAPSGAQQNAAELICLGPRLALDFARLDACRPEPLSHEETQSLLATLPERGEVRSLDQNQTRKLSSLHAVLAIHAR